MLIAGQHPSDAHASWASWVSSISRLLGGYGDREVPHRCFVGALRLKYNLSVQNIKRTVK
jgi:hypothetical protein